MRGGYFGGDIMGMMDVMGGVGGDYGHYVGIVALRGD